jgi:hypothetical protein
MSTARLRPRLRYVSKQPPQEILARIENNLLKRKTGLEGQVVQEHAFIGFPQNDQAYWTPEMHIWVRQQDDETIVYGVIGPKPKIWTMFMFLYTALLTMTFFGSSYGIIQMTLGMDAPFLWSIPLGLFFLVMLFSASHYGQYKSRKETELLKHFLEDAMKGR